MNSAVDASQKTNRDAATLDTSPATQALIDFLADLTFEAVPEAAIERSKALCLDWVASALAGAGQHPTSIFQRYAQLMGPADGPCTLLPGGGRSSAHFAALVNGAASHLVEQDDLHNASVLHPATVVFPAALATAQALGRGGRELLLAAIAGYEAGVRVGEFLGRSHYRVFHTTGTAGTIAAAVAAGKLLKLDRERLRDAIGSAATQAAGLWAFLRDGADSKQLHAGKAAADGLAAAWLASDGLSGARDVLEGPQGMAAGMSSDADPERLSDGLGQRWAVLATSFKFHASCRHTHPAADALAALMQRDGLDHTQIASVTARVHQAAIDVLGGVDVPRSVHQAKFSMGAVLGAIAVHGSADLETFAHRVLDDPDVAAFRERVVMVLDPEVDAAYPARWLGRIEVTTSDGRQLTMAIDTPKGDPDNTLSREELDDKLFRLTRFSGALDAEGAHMLSERLWSLEGRTRLDDLFDMLPVTERRS